MSLSAILGVHWAYVTTITLIQFAFLAKSKDEKMKIFISHSSQDKWIARRISEDLEAEGIKTFLDEKHMETGDVIDASISEHLRECDEMLMLLSPAALNSQWVLIEIGGARALKKRLIPILLHVSANEMPQLLSKHLARDINDIDRYYDEVVKRAKGKIKPPEEPIIPAIKQKEKPQKFKAGDRVQIADVETLTQKDKNLSPKWVAGMNRYSGKKAIVIKLIDNETVLLDIDKGSAYWATRWLTKK